MKAPLNERLGEAFVNKTYKILGLKVRPFSLWHLFLMTSGESPMLEGKAIISWAELRWAVAICRSKFPKINWPNGWELLKSLVKCPYPKIGAELFRFNEYILDHYSSPLIWHKEGSTTKAEDLLGGILYVILTLVKNGFSHNEAWNMPAGAAYWYFCTLQKEKGAEFEFVTPSEVEAMRKVALARRKNGAVIGAN